MCKIFTAYCDVHDKETGETTEECVVKRKTGKCKKPKFSEVPSKTGCCERKGDPNYPTTKTTPRRRRHSDSSYSSDKSSLDSRDMFRTKSSSEGSTRSTRTRSSTSSTGSNIRLSSRKYKKLPKTYRIMSEFMGLIR